MDTTRVRVSRCGACNRVRSGDELLHPVGLVPGHHWSVRLHRVRRRDGRADGAIRRMV
jgi:hypothetical protein